MSKPLYAILLDGGFLTKKLRQRLSRTVTAEDVQAECVRWIGLPHVSDYELLRIYFYDAHPAKNTISRPVSGASLELRKAPATSKRRNCIQSSSSCQIWRSAWVS